MGVSDYRGLGDQICSQVIRELGATIWKGSLLREHDRGEDLRRPGASVSCLEEVTCTLSSSVPITVGVHHSGDLDSFPSCEAVREPLDASRPHLSMEKGKLF